MQKVAHSEARLLDDVEGAGFERSHRDVTVTEGESGAHHHGNGIAIHELLEKGQAIHPRHFEIEQDDVRATLVDLVQCDERIRCYRHVESPGLGEYGTNRLAHHGRVVYHQHVGTRGFLRRV